MLLGFVYYGNLMQFEKHTPSAGSLIKLPCLLKEKQLFEYLKISRSQLLYPACTIFLSVLFLWFSIRPVNKNIVNPRCCSSLYSFKLAGIAGALASFTHLSKVISSKICDLHTAAKCDQPQNNTATTKN